MIHFSAEDTIEWFNRISTISEPLARQLVKKYGPQIVNFLLTDTRFLLDPDVRNPYAEGLEKLNRKLTGKERRRNEESIRRMRQEDATTFAILRALKGRDAKGVRSGLLSLLTHQKEIDTTIPWYSTGIARYPNKIIDAFEECTRHKPKSRTRRSAEEVEIYWQNRKAARIRELYSKMNPTQQEKFRQMVGFHTEELRWYDLELIRRLSMKGTPLVRRSSGNRARFRRPLSRKRR